jgi:hypothetical protein
MHACWMPGVWGSIVCSSPPSCLHPPTAALLLCPPAAAEPFESDSPKKWAQPYNARSSVTVTSDGLRTLLVVDGEPVPLSPNLSPMHSPTHSPARSPVHRSLPPVATRGPGAGTFSNILLAQGAGQQ